MLRIMKVILIVLTAHGALLATASAQTATPPALQASIGANGGLVAASQGNGAAMGLRLAFDLTGRVSVEADGAYLGRGGSDGLSANASLLVNLAAGDRGTVPYVAVGVGLYRASFDLDHDRFFGRLTGNFPAGTQMIPISGTHAFGMMQGPYSGPPVWTGPWSGSTYGPEHMPDFYVDRLGQMMVPADGRWGTRTFTDPAVAIGGGIKLAVSSRLYARPDARALIVIRNGATYTVGVISIGLGYRF